MGIAAIKRTEHQWGLSHIKEIATVATRVSVWRLTMQSNNAADGSTNNNHAAEVAVQNVNGAYGSSVVFVFIFVVSHIYYKKKRKTEEQGNEELGREQGTKQGKEETG
jgi:hypothetical protein